MRGRGCRVEVDLHGDRAELSELQQGRPESPLSKRPRTQSTSQLVQFGSSEARAGRARGRSLPSSGPTWSPSCRECHRAGCKVGQRARDAFAETALQHEPLLVSGFQAAAARDGELIALRRQLVSQALVSFGDLAGARDRCGDLRVVSG